MIGWATARPEGFVKKQQLKLWEVRVIDKLYIKKTRLSTPTPQCAAVTERFIITNAVVVKSEFLTIAL